MQIRHALLNGPLGFGAAPLGNMFRNISEEEAAATVDAAWKLGTRYFDTAPFYGAGLSEIRLGRVLAEHKRNDYLLSTKVGRLILHEVETEARDFGEKNGLFEFGRPNKIVYDYSADGTKRSIDDSLKRLGVDRIDFVWVHDIAQDFHGDAWLAQFEMARTGAFRALTQMREQGMIKGWGLGVNRVEPCELLLDLKEVKPDGFLLAGRYTLLDHEHALQRVMPKAAGQNIDIVVGGPYSSGILAGGAHFEYRPAPPEILARVERIKVIADRHNVAIKAAALQFSLAHPASAAIIPGASRPERIAEDHAALKATIPDDFWREMRQQALVAPDAPLPIYRERNGLAEASASIDVSAPPDQVWRLIGGVRLLAGLAPVHFQERAERRGPCATPRKSRGRHHRRAARGVRQCRSQLQLFHPAGAVPRFGIPVHPARPAGRRRKPLPSGMVGEVHTRGGERRGGLTAVPAHLRGWAEGNGH